MRRESRFPGLRRILRIVGLRTIGRDVDEEIRFHLDSRVEELEKEGVGRDAARATALREYGDVAASRAELVAVDRRRGGRVRRAEWWDGVAQDLRYALRGIGREPSFAAVVALTLALGIGANATMFGIIDRLMLRPPALLHDADETGRVYLRTTSRDGDERVMHNIGYKRYQELREWTSSFSATAAFFNYEMLVGTGTEARQLRVGQVSASFWPFFGVRPALGRFFVEEEDRPPTGAPVAVLSYALWQSRYGGDPDVLGRTLAVGRWDYTIIGVAPPDFAGMDPRGLALYIPITSAVGQWSKDYYQNHNMSWMEMIARRKPGVSVEAATADLTTAFRRSMAAEPNARPLDVSRPRAELGSILLQRGPQRDQSTKVATWLGAMSAIVLLIACANVANLLVARALRRRREIAVRVALGAGRARLLRQLITESIVLAALGGAAGLLAAHWGGGVLRAALLPDVQWGSTLADARTLLFTSVAALVTGILAGIAPVAQTRRSDVTGDLKAGVREGTRRHSGLRTSLLVVQATLSVILLVGAGLFARSLRNVRALDMGYDTAHVLYVTADDRTDDSGWRRNASFLTPFLERARSLPVVEAASTTITLPFYMSMIEDLYVPGIDSVSRLGDFFQNGIGTDYFRSMGTRVVRGREFTEADRKGAPLVAIVSESMARRLWPNREALGQCMKVGADTMPCTLVVGLAADIRNGDLRGTDNYQYYIPTEQKTGGPRATGLVVRTRGEARRVAEALRRDLQGIATADVYVGVRPLQDIVDPQLRPWRLGATMFGLFGALALVMAALGLYSVIAYDVAQRTHELGVRVALGARVADVLRLVVAQGLRVAVAGVILGTVIALAAGRRIGELLYEISPTDPATFVSVAAVLLLVATLASLVPAWRAARVDPAEALRAD